MLDICAISRIEKRLAEMTEHEDVTASPTRSA